MKRSKKYAEAIKQVERNKKYPLQEALELMPKLSYSKFPGTIAVQVFLNLNDKQKKETIRGNYTLPNSFGEQKKVLLFADNSYKKTGSKADIIGGEELIPDVESGKVKFDVVVAMPAMMPKIAKLGKTLGAKGLMPNPKSGTVSPDPDKVIEKFKSGMRSFRMDESGRITGVIGKTDMKPEQLEKNTSEFFTQVSNEVKKIGANIINRVIIAPSMGPSVKVDETTLLS